MNVLPGRKKILLYLHSKKKNPEDRLYPFSYCQEGLAQNVEISQNRASKLLVEMEENDLLNKESKKVRGASHKRYVYYLTDQGKKEAEQIKRDIEEEDILVKTENEETRIKLKDIDNYVQGSNSYLFAINNLDKNGVLDLTDIGDEDAFVNRRKEKELLREYIEDLKEKKDRSSNNLLLKGYVGVGKTRLVKEIERYVGELDIHFYEGKGCHESIYSFGPFQKIFSQILEESPEIVNEEYFLELFDKDDENWEDEFEALNISKQSFFDEMKNVLENFSKKRPILIFIDNLQWIDTISLQFLGYLTDELEENSVYIIGAYRDDEMNNPIPNNSKTIEVKTFDWKNTRKLLITKIGRNDILDKFVDMIYDVTEGIPLFIEALTDEMLKDGILQPLKEKYPETLEDMKLPEKVKELYDIKFKELNQKEKEVLQLCSCLEDDFCEDLIINTIKGKRGEVKKTIDDLKRSNFLKVASKGRLDFTYEMTRFTVYKILSIPRKKSLHEKLVESLKEIDEEKEVNYHFRLGKHLEKIEKFKEAAKTYLKGADKAEKSYENEKAVEIYERALNVLEEHPVQGMDKSKIHENLAGVLERMEDYKKALDHLKKAEEETEIERKLLCLNRKIARCMRKTSRYENALNYVEKGQEIFSKMKQVSFEDEKEKCKLLKEKGMVCLRKNEFEECQNIFQKMKDLSEKIESKKDKAEAIHYLGTISYYKSDFDQAKKYLQRSIEIRKNTEDLKGLAKSYNNLGVVFRNIQEPYTALKFYKKANEIKKEWGSKEGDLSALENMGIIYYDLGELDKSIEYYQKCLEIEKKIEDEHGMAATLDNIGVSYFGKGEFDKALKYHEKSLELKKKLENRSGISFSLYNMGLAYRGKSEFERALNLLKESLDIRREIEDELNVGYSRLWIGIVYIDIRNLDKSKEHLKNALDVFKMVRSDHGMGMTLTYLGRLNILENSLNEAKKYLEHSEKIKSKLEEEGFKLIVDRHFAEYYMKKNRLEKAFAYCQEALRKAKKSDMMNQLGKCRKVLGKIYCEKGVFHRGEKEFQKAIKIFNETGDKKNKAEVLFEWGNSLKEQDIDEKGKISEALKLFKECKIDVSSFLGQ